jgi:integrase
MVPLEGKKYYLYSGLSIHDLRRSGAGNLRKAGIPESVAMKITGHKNRSVFDRYDIVDVEDVQQAMKRVEQAALPTVHTTRRLLKIKS